MSERHSPRKIVRTLWQRAPLWRFSTMLAALLTLLFALFPPMPPATPPHGAHAIQADTASFTPASPATVADDSAPKNDATPKNVNLSLARPDADADPKSTTGVDGAALGRSYTGTLHAGGFDVPLPPGNWAMLANSSVDTSTVTGTVYFLGRIERRRLAEALKVFAIASKNSPGTGFDVKHCAPGNNDALFVHEEGVVPFRRQACWSIHSVYTPPWQQWADRAVHITPLDRAAAGDMAAKGVTYPQDLVAVTFTRAEQDRMLEVVHLMNPDAAKIASGVVPSAVDSEWNKRNIGRFPDKQAYIDGLKAPSMDYWHRIADAFANAAPADRSGPVAKPVPTHFAALADVDAVPHLNEEARKGYRDFLTKSKPRAFLITETGGAGVFAGGDDPLQRGLRKCKDQGIECYPYAIDDDVVWVEPASTPAPPPSHFAGLSDVEAVPYLDADKRDTYRKFATQPTPRAFLLTENGGFVDVAGGIDPLGRALRQCAAHDIVCYPYAVNGDVVWMQPKSTPAPPPSHFAALDNIDALPVAADEARRDYQTFLTKPLPRAFLITRRGGIVSAAGGIDPLGRCLRRCKEHGEECQPYAVDDEVVWTPPPTTR